MITNSNLLYFVKMLGRGFQEGSVEKGIVWFAYLSGMAK